MKDHPVIKVITSLKLTVITLAFAAVLVFLGTVAQEPMGLKLALDRFFKSFFVDHVAMKAALDKCTQMFLGWQPTPISQERLMTPGFPIFPGGYLLGTLLLTGLLASYYSRFVFAWKKAGIILTHLGVIMLLLGQVLTDQLAIESYLYLEAGDRQNYTVSHQDNELAVIFPEKGGTNRVVSIPGSRLKPGAEFRHPGLKGLRIEVKKYWPNARLARDLPDVLGSFTNQFPMGTAQARRAFNQGAQFRYFLQIAQAKDTRDGWLRMTDRLTKLDENVPGLSEEMKEDVIWFSKSFGSYLRSAVKHDVKTGTLARSNEWIIPRKVDFTMSGRNFAAGVVECFGEDGKSLGSWLVSSTTYRYGDGAPSGAMLQPLDAADAGGPSIVLRNRRYYHDYTVTLLDTQFDEYPGTRIAKNYRSTLEVHPIMGEPFESVVYMNHPLRVDGKTHYQHEMGRMSSAGGSTHTQLQVVENPGWLTPYFGCLVVAAGMLWQFLSHLIGFIRKRNTA